MVGTRMEVLELNVRSAKFAIFMPVRNGANYIASAIDSILGQGVHDFVLIVLDNCSSDGTLAIARRYSDPRIVLVEGKDNLGIYASWHRAHTWLAEGRVNAEFVTVIGHDDLFYPDFLQNILELISAYPDASLYQTHFDLIDGDDAVRRPCRPIPAREFAKDFFLARCAFMRDSFGTGYVFRASDYVKVGGIPDLPSLLWSDDLLVISLASLAYKACAGQCSFAYRLHYGSASGAVTAGKFVSLAKALSKYVAVIEENHKTFLSFDTDRLAFAQYLARQSAMLSIPFRRKLLGDETSATIDDIRRRAAAMHHPQTRPRPRPMALFDRMLSALKRLYTALRLLRQRAAP